ncbi:hypothetical protein AVEN_115750-1 [Araneus ventricosus]|uniref:Uncharacterized protein n=1 Tax=Araneus ventricosus TaxID=182803 RepID=A0A4Y2AUS9_ARAVE|nr:hypothetical protein AVEN_70745-1 [Araneus ventricosus]GBL82738.1 hypothetical protein AVEN_215093-1 [Araneus ventricosus]GBL83478.1 hypothetical protein AVEN_62357-1 [Araneus ventricosus]GBL84452.1 hypothetical protein AVEN_115750-1 [Araneus ventricosus]
MPHLYKRNIRIVGMEESTGCFTLTVDNVHDVIDRATTDDGVWGLGVDRRLLPVVLQAEDPEGGGRVHLSSAETPLVAGIGE